MKDRLHSNLERAKNSEWPPCPIWNCSISPSPRQILLSHTAVPMLPASSLSYCDGLPDLTSIEFFALSIKFHFPVADTRPCPSTTAGNNQGQLGLHLTAHICKAFHAPPPPLTVPPGCPRTTTFPHQKQNHRSVIRMYGMGGSQGVFKGSITCDFLRPRSKATCIQVMTYSRVPSWLSNTGLLLDWLIYTMGWE